MRSRSCDCSPLKLAIVGELERRPPAAPLLVEPRRDPAPRPLSRPDGPKRTSRGIATGMEVRADIPPAETWRVGRS